MKENQEITFENFYRRKFMGIVKKKFNASIYSCKLYSSDHRKELELKIKKVIDLLNGLLQRKETFDNKAVNILIGSFDDYFSFVSEFSSSIKNINNPESLKDRHFAVEDRLNKLESMLLLAQSNPNKLFLKNL